MTGDNQHSRALSEMAMTELSNGSPGSHPHVDRPNWRPGDDDADELLIQKIGDALRDGASERHFAKLLGLSRVHLWRCHMAAQIPEPLLERLCEARRAGLIKSLTVKSLAAIGRALQDGEPLRGKVERCPNCGHTLRVRLDISSAALRIVCEWIAEKETTADKRTSG
jgi:hypothetical protein